jgi:hypothetical protein
VDFEDDSDRDFPFPAYYCSSFQYLLAYVNRPKELVASEVYHLNIPVNRIAGRLKGNIWTYAGGGGLEV